MTGLTAPGLRSGSATAAATGRPGERTSSATFELLLGDCLERLSDLDDASVDAVVTDPPYGIGFMGKTWDDFGGPLGVGHGINRAGGREPGGAMKAGDSYDRTPTGNRAFQAWVEQWGAECLRVLKPGGHAVVFGGTRTYHRLAAGLEDAGFEIRDCLAWLFGSGFPKSKNIGDGFGTALKPAHEPIVLARKPLVGTVAENVAAHRTGALNIDGCRVEGVPEAPGTTPPTVMRGIYELGGGALRRAPYEIPSGRWPANVVLDEAAASMLDEQSGELHSQDPSTRLSKSAVSGVTEMGTGQSVEYADRGGASRFFYCAKTSRAERNAGLEGFETELMQSVAFGEKAHGTLPYTNAPREMKPRPRANVHPTVKPIALMRWLCRLVTPPGGLIVDPFLGSGTTGIAAVLEGFQFTGIEREPDYLAIAQARIDFWAEHGENALKIAVAIDEREAIEASGQQSLLAEGAA